MRLPAPLAAGSLGSLSGKPVHFPVFVPRVWDLSPFCPHRVAAGLRRGDGKRGRGAPGGRRSQVAELVSITIPSSHE